jgi:hypothetical protein
MMWPRAAGQFESLYGLALSMKMSSENHYARLFIILIALGIAPIFAVGCGPSGVAPGVTASRVRELAAEMTELRVRTILGEPLRVREWGPDEQILDYAIEKPFAHHSPTLWVLIRRGQVAAVQAERSILWKLDEEGIYLMRADRNWESPAFSQTFR